MTKRQQIYAEYLLKRIGFLEPHSEEFSGLISDYIKGSYGYLEEIKSVYKLTDKSDEDTIDDPFCRRYDPNVIDYLQLEYNIKRRNLIKFKSYKKQNISASDLCSYVFCPVSFSIANSIYTHPNVEELEGTRFHEAMMLQMILNTSKKHGFKKETSKNQGAIISHLKTKHPQLYNDIVGSQLIYSGHNKDQKNSYYNNDLRYVGQPDYIFENKSDKTHFVVEEKFHYVKTMINHQGVFPNHFAQLASYICLLPQFNITRGYLVHWIYNYNHDKKPYLYYAVSHRLDRNEKIESRVLTILEEVRQFTQNQVMPFDIESHSTLKCARCSYRIWCGHKTKRFDELTFPYNRKFTSLFICDFPEELKKENNSVIISVSEL